MNHTASPRPGSIARKVIGLVVVLPLLLALARLPFGLALAVSLVAVASSAYGAWLASRQGGRVLVAFATAMALLNLTSLVMLSTPSVLMGLYYLGWSYGYPMFSHWYDWHA
ncbi:hypothetical protein ACW9H6_18545 [Pseudomonas sp. SDO528_S397]